MRVLDEYAAREYLAGRGPSMARARLARDPNEAILIARGLGWPVVMKISAEGLGHKTDFKGVELGIKNEDELRSAWTRLLSAVDHAGIGASFRGILIEEHLTGSEFIIGALRDGAFGPVVMVGSGGILAELFRDTAFRLAPVDADEAERAIVSTRASRLLAGFRGSPPLPVRPLAEAVAAVSRIVADDDSVVEFDINPFILGPAGGAAADMLIRLL
jgi:acetyltransferase